MPTVSVIMPHGPQRPAQILPYAALVQNSPAHRLWQGQSVGGDPFMAFAHAAACGLSVPAGTGVALMPQRHPFEAAMQARYFAVTMGHPVVAGYGPGARDFQAAMLGGAPYRSQLGACREYLAVLRGLLAGEGVDQRGEFFSFRGRLPRTPGGPGPAVETGLGVLRPGMARLAGEAADVAISWLTPARYLRETLVPALREGAARAGRPVPRLATMVPLALAAPDRDPVELVLAGSRQHLSMPHYADMLRRSGIEVDMADDPEGSAKRLLDGDGFLYGDAAELAAGLAEFRDAGVDEIVLNVTGVQQRHGTRAAVGELRTLLREAWPEDEPGDRSAATARRGGAR